MKKRLFIALSIRGYFRFIPDKLYLKWRYSIFMNQKLNLKNPRTFNEKLQWLKLYNRKDIYTKMVNKYMAKEYVSKLFENF